MKCFRCNDIHDYEAKVGGKWVLTCAGCLAELPRLSFDAIGTDACAGLRVSAVRGRLRAEIGLGLCRLDSNSTERFRFDPEINGKITGVQSFVSVDPKVIRVERMWNAVEGRRQAFDDVPEGSVVVLKEYGLDLDWNVMRKCRALGVGYPRSGPGLLDAVAFTMSNIRVIHRTVHGRKPQQWELLTARVEFADVEQYVDLPV